MVWLKRNSWRRSPSRALRQKNCRVATLSRRSVLGHVCGAPLWAISAEAIMAKPDRAQTSHGFKERFRTAPNGRWHLADYDFSHPHFDTDWRRERVRWFRDQRGLHLEVQPKHARGAAAAGNRFEGASLRRLSTTGFGRYETIMQPSQGAGLVSGFFLYSGPYFARAMTKLILNFWAGTRAVCRPRGSSTGG